MVSIPHVSAARRGATRARLPITVPSAVSLIVGSALASGHPNAIFSPAAAKSRALGLANAGGEGEIVVSHPAERLDRVGAEVGALERGVSGAEDQPRDAGELHRARAHRARLHGGVHRGSGQGRQTEPTGQSPRAKASSASRSA